MSSHKVKSSLSKTRLQEEQIKSHERRLKKQKNDDASNIIQIPFENNNITNKIKNKLLHHGYQQQNGLFHRDVLEKIFMQLPIVDRVSMEKVCETWKCVASSMKWTDIRSYKCSTSINRTYDNRLMSESWMRKILQHCAEYLRHLLLNEVCKLNIINIVTKECLNLIEFEFVFTQELFSDKYVDYSFILTALTKLRHIKIRIVNFNDAHASIFPIDMVNNLNEQMKKIHLVFYEISWEINPLLFNLNKFNELDEVTLAHCNVSNIIKDLSKKNKMTYINLEESWTNDEVLNWPSFSTTNLLNLNLLVSRTHINNLTVVNILKNFTMLTTVCLNCNNIEIRRELNIELNNLRNLTLHGNLTTSFCTHILMSCKNLVHLEIIGQVNDYVIKDLKYLQELRFLKLINSYQFFETSVLISLSKLTKLTHLEIPNLRVSDTVVQFCGNVVLEENSEKYAVLSNLKLLEYLSLPNIKDRDMKVILRKCIKLKSLNVRSSQLLRKNLNTLTKLKYLTELTINDNYLVDDSFIEKLNRQFEKKSFKTLNFDGCVNITDDSIIQIIKKNKDLENLYLKSIKIERNTLITADKETSNRINGLILYIYSDSIMITKVTINSRWLIIYKSQ